MKIISLLTCVFAFMSLALAAGTVSPSYAGSTAAVTSAVAGEPSQAQNPQPQTFTGKIARADGKYVLNESSTNTTFVLDDQEKAKLYEGKNVKVIGTEDPGNKIIHVYDIQAA